MTAGHLILALVAFSGFLPANYFGQCVFLILEVVVAAIQAFVFVMLLTLYYQERV
jgi:F0F1-type ATP synthase membrane subunit a